MFLANHGAQWNLGVLSDPSLLVLQLLLSLPVVLEGPKVRHRMTIKHIIRKHIVLHWLEIVQNCCFGGINKVNNSHSHAYHFSPYSRWSLGSRGASGTLNSKQAKIYDRADLAIVIRSTDRCGWHLIELSCICVWGTHVIAFLSWTACHSHRTVRSWRTGSSSQTFWTSVTLVSLRKHTHTHKWIVHAAVYKVPLV